MHTRSLFVLATVAALGSSSAHACAQVPPDNVAAEAASYLEAALDTIQAVTMGGDTLPWAALRDSATSLVWGARKPADTYGAIAWALQRANKHSFLQAAAPGVVTELVDGRFGYVRVPQRGGTAIPLADSLHSGVRRLLDQSVCGWIVDLRGNGGGNMWPMLAGIGPLLGDSLVGAFGAGDEADRWYYRQGRSGIMAPSGAVETVSEVTVEPLASVPPEMPVAVLVDRGTGSSGEALAVAFHGRPAVHFLGEETAGFATVNRGSRLPDGTNMVVTTGYYVDRQGQEFPDFVRPDTTVDVGRVGWPFATDRASTAAAAWLSRQAGCR